MKHKIEQIDRLLGQIQISGDSVLLMAQARTLLKQVYMNIKEGEDGTDRE